MSAWFSPEADVPRAAKLSLRQVWPPEAVDHERPLSVVLLDPDEHPALTRTMLSDLNQHQRALRDYMSLLSEAGWSAEWMGGLEFDLWRAIIEGPFRYGQLDLTVAHVERLRYLSDACAGWIVFDDGNEETFAPISHWKNIYRGRACPRAA